MKKPPPPFIVWIFGLPSAGKTTLASGLRTQWEMAGRASMLLDGDELRGGLCRGLGFSAEDRSENLRRAAQVARIAAHSGVSSAVAMITPQESQRAMIREILADIPVLWVWADCPLSECRRRDVKGLFRRQQRGEVAQLTGVDDVFEPPAEEVLRIYTAHLTVRESVAAIGQALLQMLADGGSRGHRSGAVTGDDCNPSGKGSRPGFREPE